MNFEHLDRFDIDYFRSLDEINKEKYFIYFVRKTLDIIERKERKGENINGN